MNEFNYSFICSSRAGSSPCSSVKPSETTPTQRSVSCPRISCPPWFKEVNAGVLDTLELLSYSLLMIVQFICYIFLPLFFQLADKTECQVQRGSQTSHLAFISKPSGQIYLHLWQNILSCSYPSLSDSTWRPTHCWSALDLSPWPELWLWTLGTTFTHVLRISFQFYSFLSRPPAMVIWGVALLLPDPSISGGVPHLIPSLVLKATWTVRACF